MSRIVLDAAQEARFRQDWLNPRVLMKQMVARYGHTNDTLRRIADDLALAERADDIWTEALTAEIVRRYAAGESPAALAREKDLTRNQVVAKLSRLGVIRRRAEPKAAAPRAVKKAPAAAKPVAVLKPPPRVVIPFPRVGGCQWPHGDPQEPDFRLCGEPKARGSYCEAHAARAFQPAKPEKARAYVPRTGT